MSTGRHRVLDEAKCGQICALVAVGCSLRAAARYVGCDRGTIRREALRNDQFGQQLRRAELEAELNPIRTMQQAATTHWRAAAWLLERTQPEQYARNAAQLVKMETVQDLVARCLDVIADELSDSPENQASCRRLTHAIENTCGELAVAAITSRDPRRLRKIIAGMNTRPDPQTESPRIPGRFASSRASLTFVERYFCRIGRDLREIDRQTSVRLAPEPDMLQNSLA